MEQNYQTVGLKDWLRIPAKHPERLVECGIASTTISFPFPAQMVIYKALQGWMLGSKEGEAKTRDGEPLSLSQFLCLESGRSLLSPSTLEQDCSKYTNLLEAPLTWQAL